MTHLANSDQIQIPMQIPDSYAKSVKPASHSTDNSKISDTQQRINEIEQKVRELTLELQQLKQSLASNNNPQIQPNSIKPHSILQKESKESKDEKEEKKEATVQQKPQATCTAENPINFKNNSQYKVVMIEYCQKMNFTKPIETVTERKLSDNENICWNYLSAKGCKRSDCKWTHPKELLVNQKNKNVSIKTLMRNIEKNRFSATVVVADKSAVAQGSSKANAIYNAYQKLLTMIDIPIAMQNNVKNRYENEVSKSLKLPKIKKQKQKQKFNSLSQEWDKFDPICWDYLSDKGCNNKNCQWKHVKGDPASNKNKKPSAKPTALVQSKQNAMRMVSEIYDNEQKGNKNNDVSNLYCVVVINGKELLIGTVSGDTSAVLCTLKNKFQSGKHNKGGQSAQRFGRTYDNKINTFMKECAAQINKIFNNNTIVNCNGVILAGNGKMKKKLNQCKELSSKVEIIKTVNTLSGGVLGFREVFRGVKNNELFAANELQNKSDSIIVAEIMAMVQNEKKCDMIAIGIKEIMKAIKLRIVKYVVLTDGFYKYVIKKKSKAMRFVQNDRELYDMIEKMNITIGDNKLWKVVGYNNYLTNLCMIYKVELKIIKDECEKTKKFAKDLSGCVAVLHQSFKYLR